MKHFNPPSVATATGEESQHNISRLSSFFVNLNLVISNNRLTYCSRFYQPTHQHQPPLSLQLPLLLSMNISSHQPSLRLPHSQPTPNSSSSRNTAMPPIGPSQDHCCKQFQGPFQDHPNLPKTIYQLLFKKKKKFQNKKHYTTPQKTLWPQTQKQNE